MGSLLTLLARVTLVMAFVATAAFADDLVGNARGLLSQGLKPDAAAVRLIEQGADPEDAAAALFTANADLHAIRAVAFAVVRAGIAKDPASAVPLAAGVAGLA